MVAVVEAGTLFVVTTNVAVEWPEVTVTLAGTVADGLLLDSATLMLPEAGLLSVTVPVEEAPPTTTVGFSDTPVSVIVTGGVTVNDDV
jgi:hypothetical protein